ncbi:MAG TPA: hypothetical protein VGJ21_19610 [Terracidiphilus sp.]|jgi:hypothetical protein
MRRLLQISAMLVITLVALQPALDGLARSIWMGPACPMGMSAMSADCPMAQQAAQAGCAQDCCNHALPQSAVISAIAAKPKGGAPAPMITATAAPLQVQATSASVTMPAASSSPPPLYILNQVFRI